MEVSTGELGSSRRWASSVMDGRLSASPAYYQTQGAAEIQLNSADTWIATKIVPTCDWELDALSNFVTAVTSAGNQNFFIYADGEKPEPNGALSSALIKFHADQTDNSTPLTVSATSEDPGGLHPAWKAFSTGSNTYWQSADDPATTPQDLEIDLGAGVEKWVNKMILRASPDASADSRCFPKSFSVLAKQDGGGSYETLAVVSSSIDPGGSGRIIVTWRPLKPYRYFKITVTDNHGTGAFVCVGELNWIEATMESAPADTSTASLGSVSSGAVDDEWIRLTIDPANRPRFRRGRPVWLVCKGSAGSDFSLTAGRQSTVAGSGFPDEMRGSKYTTDGGVTWSRCLMDDRNALWNLILNSTEDHVPRLTYGRVTGPSVYIPHSGLIEIPEEGIHLDCSALTEGAVYSVYGYVDGGALALEASETRRTFEDGIEVKTGEPDKRFLGLIAPMEIQTGKAGPIDVTDYRATANSANRRMKPLGKVPYASTTVHTITSPSLHMREVALVPGDLSVRVLILGSSSVHVTCDLRFNMQAGGFAFNFAVDEVYGVLDTQPGQFGELNGDGVDFGRFGGTLLLDEGLRDIRPIVEANAGSVIRLCMVGTYSQYLGVNGALLS